MPVPAVDLLALDSKGDRIMKTLKIRSRLGLGLWVALAWGLAPAGPQRGARFHFFLTRDQGLLDSSVHRDWNDYMLFCSSKLHSRFLYSETTSQMQTWLQRSEGFAPVSYCRSLTNLPTGNFVMVRS
jgi:hypothetical protein